MSDISVLLQIIGILLLVPFFGWAIYLLRRRFVYYVENTMTLEALTAVGLVLFFWVESTVLRHALDQHMLWYLFSILGLVVASFALYAHVIISLASRILVDLVIPGDQAATNQPRFGPVDALERSEDYEGALQEYLVLARIYPRNFEVLRRTGRVHEILDQPEDAITWYHRARKRAGSASEALVAVNRLCALYDGALDQPEQADAALDQYLQDYPDSLDYKVVAGRLERRAHRTAPHHLSAELQPLEERPVAPDDEAQAPADSTRLPAVGPEIAATEGKSELVTLESEGVAAPPERVQQAPRPAGKRKKDTPIPLDRLEQVGASDTVDASPPPHANGRRAGDKASGSRKKVARATPPTSLEPLDVIEPARDMPAKTRPKPKSKGDSSKTQPKSSLAIEPLDDDA